MSLEKNDHNDTILLRFIAIILILNSHMDAYYPMKFIGTGGAIGNTIFFMLSSFGLFLSHQQKPKSFYIWYSDRIKRIYPSVWVTLLLIVIPVKLFSGHLHISDLLPFAGGFFYPPFWFLQALIIYYFIGWFILNEFSERKLFTGIIISIALYVSLYLFYLDLSQFSIVRLPFKFFYFVIVYFLGIYMALHSKRIKYSGKRDIVIALLSLIIIYSHKFAMTKHILSNIQFIQHVFGIVLVYYLLKISRLSLINENLMNSFISKPIKYIGGLTLEIYIVHVSISPLFINLNLSFPINVFLFLSSVFLLSTIINRISSAFVSLNIFQPVQYETKNV